MNAKQRKVAFFDLDGTLIKAHLWLGLVKHNLKFKKNVFETCWYIFSHMALTPFWLIRLISKERYYRTWGEDASRMIKGTEVAKVKDTLNWLSDKYLLPTIKKNIFERLKRHQKEGFLTILTSGSFEDLLKIIASRLEINFTVGTKLETIKGKFTGKIIRPLCFGRGKVERIEYLVKEKNLSINFKESFAYSDGIFDLPLLKLVGHPVVVDPGKELLEIAGKKGWVILKA